ncbi:YhgE/Pip domain-containing protein [Halobacillus sp. B23F22_1]|uniref:YhgE/Pip domain-containing protein n=1 Tax=Halobacillus sp. B23F22_1 TaxID=3459514 RepID=UPI00373EA3B6
MKRIIVLCMAIFLLMPSFLISAEQNETSKDEEKNEKEGSYSSKHEVVYSTLTAAGNQEEMYVVNNFSIEETGKIIDYGAYTNVQNLTNVSDIKQEDERIQMTAEEDEFYYQGDLEDKPLPWNINVTYQLDGEKMTPEDLLGKNGELQLQINTDKNENAESFFYENYLLQMTVTLDSDRYDNIEAPDGTVANAGKDRQVTFTAMPDKEGSFSINADVKDLEMESIEIAAVPPSMAIDAPDTGAMTDDMNSLSAATAEVHRGVGKLKSGIAELNNGAASLNDGSAQYNNGVQELNAGSTELVEGSAAIQTSLQTMSEQVGSDTEDMNVEELQELEDGLKQLSGGLEEADKSLASLRNEFGNAYKSLDEAVESIPGYDISDEDIESLYESGADEEVIDQLVETYQSAQSTKQTYADGKEAFGAVSSSLETNAGSLSEMSDRLLQVADQTEGSLEGVDFTASIQQLQQGLKELSSNYNEFHSGLVEYTDGASELASSYQEIHGGIAGLTDGIDELEQGASELHEGTGELAASTSDIPEQMQSEIDQMVEEYDKSDVEPVSFVSEENKKVESVQFVIKTESIKKVEEQTETPEEEEEEKGFWDRLLNLFR